MARTTKLVPPAKSRCCQLVLVESCDVRCTSELVKLQGESDREEEELVTNCD